MFTDFHVTSEMCTREQICPLLRSKFLYVVFLRQPLNPNNLLYFMAWDVHRPSCYFRDEQYEADMGPRLGIYFTVLSFCNNYRIQRTCMLPLYLKVNIICFRCPLGSVSSLSRHTHDRWAVDVYVVAEDIPHEERSLGP
ncbi:hypothetical protein J6590_054605 [Homalodisca vitripennis]|nr:hypothetical protein J6590_054605 [Homalodisca vitripennis]